MLMGLLQEAGGCTLGDSMVTLIPDCRTATGKWGEGMLVSHKRKLLCSSGSPSVRSRATCFSSSGIQDLTRWQFCRHTQCPAPQEKLNEDACSVNTFILLHFGCLSSPADPSNLLCQALVFADFGLFLPHV